MIDGLHPYPEIKPTGVGWLARLPAGWGLHRAKHSFREVDERSEQGDEELLSVSHKTGVTPRSQKNITMFMAESYEGHKVCRPGDIVVNTMWAWMAALGVSRHIGIVSPAYGITGRGMRYSLSPNTSTICSELKLIGPNMCAVREASQHRDSASIPRIFSTFHSFSRRSASSG